MADASVISRMNGKPRELNQAGTGTAELVFTSDGTVPIICPFPDALRDRLLEGTVTSIRAVRFTVRAWGRITGGGTTNYTAQLQWGTSATPTSNADVDSGAAVAVNSANGKWFMESELIVDSTSLTIDGTSANLILGSTRTLTGPATSATATKTLSLTSTSVQGFVVTGTFSAGFATNAAYLDGFEIVK